jgi:two-component system, NtrC family, sensor kinase
MSTKSFPLAKYFPLPLKASIPLVLLVFGGSISIFSFQRELSYSGLRAERQILGEAQFTADQTSSTLEYLFRKLDEEGANLVVSKVGGNSRVRVAAMIDEKDQILLATHYELRGTAIQETDLRAFTADIYAVRKNLAGQTTLSSDGNSVRSVYPVVLGAKDGEIRPSKVGTLVIEYEVETSKQQAFNHALQRSLESTGILLGLSMGVWWLFSLTLTERAKRLKRASESFAQGDLSVRTELRGIDEMAQISASLDRMADRIQANQQALKSLADRRALSNQLSAQIRESLELDQIVNTSVQAIQQLFSIDRCKFLWRQVNESGVVEFKLNCVATDISQLTHLSHYPVQELPTLQPHLLKAEIFRIDDLETDEQLSEADRSLLIANGFKSILCTALYTRSNRIGIIICEHFQAMRPWLDDEIELLASVADQLSIAISQSDLYQTTVQSAGQASNQAEKLQTTLVELRQAQTKLIHTEKMSSLGQLVAGVAHEINNPVNFIYGNLECADGYLDNLLSLIELYQQQYPSSDPKIHQFAQKMDLPFVISDFPKLMESMKLGAERILEIVSSLRNFSRLDEAEYKLVNLHDGLNSTVMMLKHRLKNQSDRGEITIITDFADIPEIECHAGQLNQVFMNIIANAIDALDEYYAAQGQEPDFPALAIRLSTCITPDQFVRISIADNGPGIPESTQKKLFDPFFTTKEIGKGTGLGLSISYQIITEKHEGRLTCISQSGHGTEFQIDLPLRQKSDASTSNASKLVAATSEVEDISLRGLIE